MRMASQVFGLPTYLPTYLLRQLSGAPLLAAGGNHASERGADASSVGLSNEQQSD